MRLIGNWTWQTLRSLYPCDAIILTFMLQMLWCKTWKGCTQMFPAFSLPSPLIQQEGLWLTFAWAMLIPFNTAN